MTEIPKLDDLLQDKVISHTIKNLTAPGENYGSLMLSVDVITEHKKMNLVAKTLPPNPLMQEMFNCSVTFRNEIAFYKNIVPTLRSFQKQHGVDKVINFTAEYLGSRPNLHGKNENIDADAVLLLENLKIKGFSNLDRTVGFDLEGSKLVLWNLAQLHGVGIALKLQEPEIFNTVVKPFLPPFTVAKETKDDWNVKYLKIIHEVPELVPYLDRLKGISADIYPAPPAREPWGTISHCDCWVNNIMVRLENGHPVENKLVDFQIADYGSPAKDVLFFLFSSVHNDLIKQHCDDLIRYYHDRLLDVLQDLKCDVKDFSFAEFTKELEFEARHTQFMHTALMLFPIFATKMEEFNMEEYTPSDFGRGEVSREHREKLILLVEEFVKRDWI